MTTKRFANAVDAMGVWSDRPLSADELLAMRTLSVIPGTTTCLHEDSNEVADWTRGALGACERFRLFALAFIAAEEKTLPAETNASTRKGQEAMIKAVQVLL